MVTEEEIERVARLMGLEVDDHSEYVEKVHAMIDYFEILDSAGDGSEAVSMPAVPVSRLRPDEHVPFGDPLIESLKHSRGTYVRAPKMSR